MGNPTQDAELTVTVKRIDEKLDRLIVKLDELVEMARVRAKSASTPSTSMHDGMGD